MTAQALTNHRRNPNNNLLVLVLLFCLDNVRLSTASSSSVPSSITSAQRSSTAEPFSEDAIANFLRSRCGSTDADGSPAIWSYEGTLTDPMTGKVIAEVEGLEVSKSLPVIKPSQLSDSNDQSVIGSLTAKKLLCTHENSPSIPQWDAATTVLSRRLFCYRRPSSSSRIENPNSTAKSKDFSPYNSLLTSLRLRPDGPLRHLSPLENTAIYDSAVTYISRNKGREMVVFSERGGRDGSSEDGDRYGEDNTKHYIMGPAQIGNSGDERLSDAFDFALHAQKGALNNKSESDGPMLPPLKLPSGNQVGSEEVVISPPRSRFLQFGKGDGNGSASERKYGSVRETYRYTLGNDLVEDGTNGDKLDFFDRIKEKMGMKPATQEEEATQSQPKCTVRYTRYGEAPPWYAPGRSCALELRGKRITLPSSIAIPVDGEGDTADSSALSQHLPSLASWAASKSNFWSGWPAVFSSRDDLKRQYYQLPPKSEDEKAKHAVRLFCNSKEPCIGPLEDYPGNERKQWLATTENALSKIQSSIRRLSKSFIMSEVPTSK